MEILAFIIVCIGLIGLLNAVKPALQIIQMSNHQHKGWLILLSMIMMFVLGYIGYLWMLINKQINIVDIVVSAVFCGGGGFVYIITRMSRQTIADLKEIAEQKHYQAYHDALTGLPNRLYYYEEMDKLVEQPNKQFCCMLVDVDNFKPINDTYGHDHGDMVLKTIAERLNASIPERAMAARMGGDEFAILIPDISVDESILLTQGIQEKLAHPLDCGEFQAPVKVSIGITFYPADGLNRENLLISADIAMYQAKRGSRSYQVFRPDMELPKVVNYHD
ncbi:MAG: GGDEF domain-containing protein [Shewanella sp.]|nr:GGDEF domain-containing protein [Shewanella sp.]MCF1430386.1 GGDEF domain-containing protein [Shewanella sp.]MCF1437551.1 GGDEF domain-containing protein [Shewanella sp.]MCF1457143.1 GGDEF domain-containing protein [Shewanella sp.]